jgi:hypothetical protein
MSRLRANMFEDNEDREISRQVRQIADGVRAGNIDIAPENDIFSDVVGNYLGVGGPLWDPDKTMWSPVQGFVAPDEDTLALRQQYAEVPSMVLLYLRRTRKTKLPSR